jgi:methylmalonyl-CoA epimerase
VSRDADVSPEIAHVAVIVRDLDAAEAFPAAALGLPPGGRTVVAGEGVAVAFVAVGRADVELIQPLGHGGPLLKFLESRGEGIHHVAIAVPDVRAAIARAEAAGLRFLGQAPRPGAHGAEVAFIHPSCLNGLLVEFVEMA